MQKPNRTLALAFLAILFSGCMAAAQAPAGPSADPSKALLQMAQRFENNFMALAKAMPADKFSFAPSPETFKPGSPAKFEGVRTFAQQITHVADFGFRMYAPFGGKPDTDLDLKNLDKLTSKDDVLKALQASFDYQNKVIATITAENAFTPQGPRNMNLILAVLTVMNDDNDHYGQLVEYCRMNGITPPASERPAAPAAAHQF